MTLEITSLDIQPKVGQSGVPYAIINCTFRVFDDPYLHGLCMSDASEYGRSTTVDDIDRFEHWLEHSWEHGARYEGLKGAWVMKDPIWTYIEKFDTFWFREWVSDGPITRAIYAELAHYCRTGELPAVYRSTDEGVVVRHLKTLNMYWD